jgi:hypothetical protein
MESLTIHTKIIKLTFVDYCFANEKNFQNFHNFLWLVAFISRKTADVIKCHNFDSAIISINLGPALEVLCSDVSLLDGQNLSIQL